MGMEEAKKVKDWVEEAVLEVINSRIPTKFYIYNSSVFTVPYDTVARIIAVGKGGLGNGSGCGGGGGGTAVKLAELKKGDKITITLNDEKTTAACKDWAISGYNGGDGSWADAYSYLPGPGGAAEGGGVKLTTSSRVVGSDIQLIAGGRGGYRNSDGEGTIISQGGRHGYSDYGGGGASYFGGNGSYHYDTGAGDGGDGLYGGGNGGPFYNNALHSDAKPRYAGNGGNSIYGYGGKGGRAETRDVGAPVGGNGGYGGIRGGKGGKAYWNVTDPANDGYTKPILTADGQDGESGIYYPIFNTPSQLPIGSGQGGGCNTNSASQYNYSLPGVGAVIIELGEDRFLDTYV